MRTSAISLSGTCLPLGRVDREVLHVGHAVAGAGNAPHLHVVGLAADEDVADLLAGQPHGGLAADVAGRDPVPTRLVDVDLDLDLWDLLDLLDAARR